MSGAKTTLLQTSLLDTAETAIGTTTPLGKAHTMPPFFQEGDKRMLSADAAFVAYPRPKTPGCSLTWSGNQEEFCLDINDSEQIERLAPLKIRGENDTVYTVVGSRAVTEGLPIWISGTVTGEPVSSVARGTRFCWEEGWGFTCSRTILHYVTTLVAVKVSEVTAALRSTPPLTRTATSPWWVFCRKPFGWRRAHFQLLEAGRRRVQSEAAWCSRFRRPRRGSGGRARGLFLRL